MISVAPLVRVVVVNFNGGELTLECLRSILATDWPSDRLDVVLVDNASTDGIADLVEHELAGVRVLRSPTNLGFSGGCNLGLADRSECAHIALVNNDATVEPGWLQPLVAALDADDHVGAAAPKILFAGNFREVVLRAPTVRPGRGDHRDLGVRVSGARVGDTDVWQRTQLVRGFHGIEPPARPSEPSGEWTGAEAVLRVPVAGSDLGVRLRLSSLAPATVTLVSGDRTEQVRVTPDAAWIEVPSGGAPVTVVNNAGSVLTPDLFGADRGYQDVDRGQFDAPEDVFAWCGAAVLLRREYLDEVGLFDERLFLYYEDLELAWRGGARGWRYRYVPDSVVHHVHAATSGDGSRRKRYFEERNRLLVLTRHAGGRDVRRALWRYVLVTGSYARRDIWSRVFRGGLPSRAVVGTRERALVAYLWRAPMMLDARRRDRAVRSRG